MDPRAKLERRFVEATTRFPRESRTQTRAEGQNKVTRLIWSPAELRCFVCQTGASSKSLWTRNRIPYNFLFKGGFKHHHHLLVANLK